MKNVENTVKDFMKNLQWDLRASYNSSSCLNKKQCEFVKDRLQELLEKERK